MSAQYAHLDGRHWCNEDFVNEVRQLYPATTKKIPLGYSTYTGWTGLDEVFFIQHEPLDDKAKFEGQIFEASFNPAGSDNFQTKVLEMVEHGSPKAESTDKKASVAEAMWGDTLEERQLKVAAVAKAARRGGGLYGYPKPIQSSCERAVKKLNRRASILMKKSAQRNPDIIGFLETHATRGGSMPARVLLSAYKNSMPQTSWNEVQLNGTVALAQRMASQDKEAKTKYGIYGFPAKTAKMGLTACATVREVAGLIASDLYRRKQAAYGRVTGFLDEHSKTARCGASNLILACYPEQGFKFRRRRQANVTDPNSVDAWITWEPEQD